MFIGLLLSISQFLSLVNISQRKSIAKSWFYHTLKSEKGDGALQAKGIPC